MVELLEANGFVRVGTFSYEAYDEELDDLLRTVRSFLQHLRNRPQRVGVDHIWVYIDKTP